MRQNNPNTGFGGFGGGFGGGAYNSNQSAFNLINNNGLSKIPSNTSTSMSKINSAFGYGNLQSNFAKQSNNDYLEMLQRFNQNPSSAGPSPGALSLGRHPSMRDQIPVEDANPKSQK
jgi:hypothetical protein